MIPIRAHAAWRGSADCQHCAIRATALFAELREEDFRLIHEPIDELAYGAGESLYVQGPGAGCLYTVRSGMIKLLRHTPDGRERILRVLRPGDVAGLEALAGSDYDSEAVALTDITVCRVPSQVIHGLNRDAPRIHGMLMRKWHEALKQANDWLAELNFGAAQQRVRHFAWHMRHPAQPTVTTLFARDDMGAMMGLQPETVSREISVLLKERILQRLENSGRVYRILDPSRLRGGAA